MSAAASSAPVALFFFNRPEHARRTLEALVRNDAAIQTDVFIYCDGPRDERDKAEVGRVRTLAATVTGFRSVHIVCEETNLGLSQSIIRGVTEVDEQHGRVIVVEDDIVTARSFLTYMNDALERYADEPRVWHISGWNYPISSKDIAPFFFWQVMNCWGWATWADRWTHYRKEPARLLRDWSDERIRAFNLDGACDFFTQVRDTASGQIDTWDIFWYATIFENEGLCLNPTRSFARNIGLDGTGIHGEQRREQEIDLYRAYEGLPKLQVTPNAEAISRVRAHLRSQRSIGFRLSRRLDQLIHRLSRGR